MTRHQVCGLFSGTRGVGTLSTGPTQEKMDHKCRQWAVGSEQLVVVASEAASNTLDSHHMHFLQIYPRRTSSTLLLISSNIDSVHNAQEK